MRQGTVLEAIVAQKLIDKRNLTYNRLVYLPSLLCCLIARGIEVKLTIYGNIRSVLSKLAVALSVA
jgi:hypothetical protein